MNPKMNSPITLVLLDRLNRKVFEFMKPYNECAELTVIHRDEKTYVYQHQTEFSSDKIFFKEAKQILDLDPAPVLTELKADLQLDARDLQEVLALLQFNEISLIRTLAIVQDWANGVKPLSSDLPAKSQDNPLISSDQCAMDVLREIREDIIKRRELDVEAALVVQEIADHCDDFSEWKKKLIPVIDHLRSHSHGKPVSEDFKATHTIHVGSANRVRGFSLEEGTTELFQFIVKDDGSLTSEMKAAGVTVENVPGIGRVASLPIKRMFDGPVLGKDPMDVAVAVITDIEAAAELAMRQFSDNVRHAIQKFRASQ